MLAEEFGSGAVEWLGVWYKTLLASAATGGALSVVDSLSPAGSGPPRHIHRREDETFVILTGACEFWIEGSRSTHRAGESVFIPRGKEHTFRVTDDGPSRHLVILTPGGFEGFFAEMAGGGFRIPQDMGRIDEAAARYDLAFTGPPLEA